MIPLTGDELRALVVARDMLERKACERMSDYECAVIAHQAILAVLRNSFLDIGGSGE